VIDVYTYILLFYLLSQEHETQKFYTVGDD